MVVLGFVLCFFEALLEVLVMIAVVGVPFFLMGLVWELCKRGVKHYKSGTFRAKWHRKIYNFLVHKGYDSNVAYRTATRITHWE